jgi:hypothetical protein
MMHLPSDDEIQAVLRYSWNIPYHNKYNCGRPQLLLQQQRASALLKRRFVVLSVSFMVIIIVIIAISTATVSAWMIPNRMVVVRSPLLLHSPPQQKLHIHGNDKSSSSDDVRTFMTDGTVADPAPASTNTTTIVDDTTMESNISHDELMYTLGINLGRQLGDVRALVHNGTELASVARGLLDTVVGRLSESEQTFYLKKRGQELNIFITERAYVMAVFVFWFVHVVVASCGYP